MTGMDGTSQSRQAPRCAICRKPAMAGFKPFCSQRCADVDLGRWLSGTYAIPGGPLGEDGDGAPQPAPQTLDDTPDGDDTGR